MSHQDIIQTLIEWIDEHIDQPLNIDVVARKSGYSKWYLQRMFRAVMHQTLGDYIRQRRLLLAAEARGPPNDPSLILRWIWATCRSRRSHGYFAGSSTAPQRLSSSNFRLSVHMQGLSSFAARWPATA